MEKNILRSGRLFLNGRLYSTTTLSPYVRESKTSWDSGFHAVYSGFQSWSVELGFWIPIVSGIPDSLGCIPDSKAQDSGFL